MAWINGQWVEDEPTFGGMLGGFGGQEVDRGPRQPFAPPTDQLPNYSQGPQMQPSPYQPTQWAGPNAIYPNWDDPAGPFAKSILDSLFKAILINSFCFSVQSKFSI